VGHQAASQVCLPRSEEQTSATNCSCDSPTTCIPFRRQTLLGTHMVCNITLYIQGTCLAHHTHSIKQRRHGPQHTRSSSQSCTVPSACHGGSSSQVVKAVGASICTGQTSPTGGCIHSQTLVCGIVHMRTQLCAAVQRCAHVHMTGLE
jgi:hypothetical protein